VAGLKYGQIGRWWDIVHHDWRNAISDRETGYQRQRLRTQGGQYSENRTIYIVIASYPVIVCKYQMDSCLCCQLDSANIPLTCWRRKGPGVPPLVELRQSRPELMPPLPGTPAVPPKSSGENVCVQHSQIHGMPPGYLYILTPLSYTRLSNHDAYAKDGKRDTHCLPHLLTDEGTSTASYAIYWMLMQLTSILQMKAADSAKRNIKTSIDRKEQDLSGYYYR